MKAPHREDVDCRSMLQITTPRKVGASCIRLRFVDIRNHSCIVGVRLYYYYSSLGQSLKYNYVAIELYPVRQCHPVALDGVSGAHAFESSFHFTFDE